MALATSGRFRSCSTPTCSPALPAGWRSKTHHDVPCSGRFCPRRESNATNESSGRRASSTTTQKALDFDGELQHWTRVVDRTGTPTVRRIAKRSRNLALGLKEHRYPMVFFSRIFDFFCRLLRWQSCESVVSIAAPAIRWRKLVGRGKQYFKRWFRSR